ncbi:hypothetical protein ABXN37_23755 [Piscinibacter sakaiensis]|uniref:Uncharacterized protein n=1 Tax=Piscinibacter sakaiensis TaxID=1547922 RepID=A0A0K8P7I0_PISS1|nr:hypothetical protein [Piscinibacter sakaiensis]GAP38145.1 hypothetical protein ISF6_4339 [Piscinibacter sakaiensis]
MQLYEHEVLVYVWRFSGFRTGHASIKLKAPGLLNPAANGKQHQYVSWWPRGGPNDPGGLRWRDAAPSTSYRSDRREELSPKTRQALASGRFKAMGRQKASLPYEPKLGEDPLTDANAWGLSADAKIRLPGLGNAGLVFGLDIGAMVRWWNLFTHSGSNEFNILKLNCSRVAAMCLLAGGAARYCKPPTRAFNLWTPNSIEAWALKLDSALKARNEAAKEIELERLPSNDQPPSYLLDVGTWQKATKPGSFSVRRGQVLKIDKLLHEYGVVAGRTDAEGQREALNVLEQILGQVHSHIVQKGDGSRNREVVLQLGQHVLKLYRERSVRLALLKQSQAKNLVGASKYQLLDEYNALMAEGLKLGTESWGQ